MAKLGLTNQIRDFLAFARKQGGTLTLVVRENTKFSKELEELIKRRQVVRRNVLPDR